MSDNSAVTSGVRIGVVMAFVISYSMWQSFWWMFLHGIFGWLYLIYWGIKY